ncbi:N-acetyltransferase [Nakamurella sp. A5-74]|uniref:N-acetyltransferase n=1 Tax=Nakamurella sp. A5-74 TaxID=3158264 RepID=A0AAU8DK54_9ACTN
MSFTDPNQPVPTGLRTDDFVMRPITADDAPNDYDAVMETREHLRLWEQSTWPADDFTIEANREDLAGLELRHTEHRAFTYTVLDPGTAECLGCVYVFPTSATFLAKCTVTPMGVEEWDAVDAVVYFWVRSSRMETGLDAHLLGALRRWFASEWTLENTVYVTNEEFTQQVHLIDSTTLTLQFRFIEPGKPGMYLAYG